MNLDFLFVVMSLILYSFYFKLMLMSFSSNEMGSRSRIKTQAEEEHYRLEKASLLNKLIFKDKELSKRKFKILKTFINLTRGDPMELENFFKSKEFKNIQKLNSS